MKSTILTILLSAAVTTVAVAENKPERGDRGPGPEARERMREKIFDRLDKDNNGAVSLEEFLAAPPMARGHRPPRPEGRERMRDSIFERLDKDGDKGITLEEFLENPRIKRADDQEKAKAAASRRFNQVDSDSDGRITKKEFDAAADEMRKKVADRMKERRGDKGPRDKKRGDRGKPKAD